MNEELQHLTEKSTEYLGFKNENIDKVSPSVCHGVQSPVESRFQDCLFDEETMDQNVEALGAVGGRTAPTQTSISGNTYFCTSSLCPVIQI